MLVVDDREVNEHPKILELLDLPDIKVIRLEAADYSFLDANDEPVGIERCDISNLAQKLRSGELESQLRQCDEMYSVIYLLTEGVYDHVSDLLAVYGESGRGYFRKFVYPNTRYDYIIGALIRLEAMGIRMIHTPTFACTMKAIKLIYDQNRKSEDEHTLFQRIRPIKIPVKLSANPAVPKLMALCPRLPEKTAIRLLHKYDNIWNILHANEGEILGIEGMGRGLLARLKREIGKE